MTAALELSTLFQTFACMKGDTADVNNPAYCLLEQWRGRFSAHERAVAWGALDRQLLKTPSAGACLWLLNAHPNEVLCGLEEIVGFRWNINDAMLQALMRRVSLDVSTPGVATDTWKSAVETLYEFLAHVFTTAVQNNTVSPIGIKAVVDTRKVLDNFNHKWSVDLHNYFPDDIVNQMRNDPHNSVRMAQQQLAREIIYACKSSSNSFDHFQESQGFFEKTVAHSLNDQQNPNGVLHGALKCLCANMTAPALKQAVHFLQNNGWDASSVWDLLNNNTLIRACHNRDHEYIDLVSSLATPQHQAQLFTWVLEGIACNFFMGVDHNNITLSSCVETILQKPYAQHKPLPIEIKAICPYQNHVIKTLKNNPHSSIEQYHPTLEAYLKHTTEHFYSDDTFKAVELLKAIDSPSLRGAIDFWGQLHGVDYQLEGLKTLLLKPGIINSPHSELEQVLYEKIAAMQNYINISGAIDTSNGVKAASRKM